MECIEVLTWLLRMMTLLRKDQKTRALSTATAKWMSFIIPISSTDCSSEAMRQSSDHTYMMKRYLWDLDRLRRS